MLYSNFVSLLVHINFLELIFTSRHIYTSPPTATYHGGRWLGQAVNTHRQLPAGAVPFFLPLL